MVAAAHVTNTSTPWLVEGRAGPAQMMLSTACCCIVEKMTGCLLEATVGAGFIDDASQRVYSCTPCSTLWLLSCSRGGEPLSCSCFLTLAT